MESTFRAFALCALGLEKTVQAELTRLGLKPSGRAAGRVFFEANLAGLFRANLCLRTAERVLIEVARYRAADFDALFEGAMAAPWEDYVGREDRLTIERVRIRESTLSAQTSVQSVIHKAAYEKLTDEYGVELMPERGTERAARVYLDEDEVLIGLDSSGEGLHRRGYRKSTAEAPLKETLAAAMLFHSGWNRRIPLVDLFCGSGTLLIEAALFGMDIAPGLGRSFALEDMPIADEKVFEAEREAAKARIRHDADLVLSGSDKDEGVLEAARANARLAGVGDRIVFTRSSAEDVTPSGEPGYVLSNPPYGLRLGTPEEAEELYRSLGLLAPAWKGWGLGFITIRKDFGLFFGRRATAEHKMMNGAEEQWFHWFPPGYEDTKPRAFAEDEEAEGEVPSARPAARRERHDSGAGQHGGERRYGSGRYGDREQPEGRRSRYDSHDREGERKPWPRREGEHDRGGERRPFARRDDRERDGERRPYPRRDGDHDRGGERRPFVRRDDRERDGERRPYPRREGEHDRGGERRPFPRRDDRERDGERRPYPRREGDQDRGGERRPYPRREGEHDRGGERRPFVRRDDRERDGERRPYPRRDGDHSRGGEHRPFPRREGDRDRGGERKPWPRRDGDRPYRKPEDDGARDD